MAIMEWLLAHVTWAVITLHERTKRRRWAPGVGAGAVIYAGGGGVTGGEDVVKLEKTRVKTQNIELEKEKEKSTSLKTKINKKHRRKFLSRELG